MSPRDDKDDDAWRRRREREDEQEKAAELEKVSKQGGLAIGQSEKSFGRDLSTEQLNAMLQAAQITIEQVSQLYTQYIAGVEKLPPNEARKKLELMMLQIQNAAKSTPSMKFKTQTLISTFHTHRDRWDRTLKDLESGKIRRRGPGG